MARVIAVVVAGLLLLIPTSFAFAFGEDKEDRGMVLTAAAADDGAQSIVAPVDKLDRETGRQRADSE